MTQRSLLSLVAALGLVVLAASTASPVCVNYEDYMHWMHAERLPDGGSLSDIARTSNLVAVARCNYGVDFLDVSDPHDPTYLGWSPVSEDGCGAVFDAPYLYVADGDSGLTVINATDPTAPFICGRAPGIGYSECVTRTRDLILVGGEEGVWTVLYDDPTAPFPEDSIESADFVLDLALGMEDEYVFMAEGGSGIEIANLAGLYVASTIPTTGDVDCLLVASHYLYAGMEDSWGDSLLVYDVIDPANPQFVTSIELDDPPLDIQFAYQRLWVTTQWGIDVVDLAGGYDDPELTGFVRTYGKAEVAIPTSNRLLVGTRTATSEDGYVGLEIIRIGFIDMVEPEDLIAMDTPIDIAASGEYGYVTSFDGNLYVLDLLTHTAPYSEYVGQEPTGVALLDDMAYVCAYFGDLHAINISDPTDPELTASGDGYAYPWALDCAGDRAYVGPSSSNLCVFDLSDADTIAMISVTEVDGGSLEGALVHGDYCFCAGAQDGVAALHVFDISDPDTAVAVGTWVGEGSLKAYDVQIVDDLAYVCGFDRFFVLDVSTPSSPTTVGWVRTKGRHQGVSVGEGYAYIAGYNGGFFVIDVTTPSDPRIAGQYVEWSVGTRSALVHGEYVYVLDETDGVFVFGRHCNDMVGVPEHDDPMPMSRLASAPNPFGQSAELSFEMPAAGHVELAIYDVAGRLVTTLIDAPLAAGKRAAHWDGRSSSGDEVAEGIYFARLTIEDEIATAKIALLR